MHPILLVVGASGGLGGSTLAAATAARIGAVLVDGDPLSPGVDATAALEDEPGLRWPDLVGLDGTVDGRRLLRALPGTSPPVLSGAGPAVVAPHVVASVVGALREVTPVVVDLPRAAITSADLLDTASVVVLLVGLRPRQVRDAHVMARALAGRGVPARVVTRGSRRAERVGEEVAEHLGLPWVEHLEDCPGVLRDEGRGLAPRPRGAVGRVSGEIATLLPEVPVADRLVLVDRAS